MIVRVIDMVRSALHGVSDFEVVVATDDDRIANTAKSVGCLSIMTSSDLSTGSARVLAAALQYRPTPSLVINVQGDAPFVPAEAVLSIIRALETGVQAATPVVSLNWADLDALRLHKQTAPFSGTTCIVGSRGEAIWFSKQIIPAIRDEGHLRAQGPRSPVLRHLGLYGFTMDTLRLFHSLSPSPQEKLEGLEQLRLLEAGVPIQTCLVNERQRIPIGGIDTLEDIALAERLIALHGEPLTQ